MSALLRICSPGRPLRGVDPLQAGSGWLAAGPAVSSAPVSAGRAIVRNVGDEPIDGLDSDFEAGARAEVATPAPRLSPLGAGELILAAREVRGLSQRLLAERVKTSQPSLASLESGNRLPSVRTWLRVATAAGFDLVIGLRRRDAEPPDPDDLRDLGFIVIGILDSNDQDGLADFRPLRLPSPFEGPR
jgi:transcriptional regulator with XRE-family HTH domain